MTANLHQNLRRPHAVRLIVEAAAVEGATNMARDEILLEQANRFGSATMRWYQWAEPTLSLGYFQSDDPLVMPGTSRVRRLSGGGAILHDREWTYSLAMPRADLADATSLYAIVHSAIVDTLNRCGVSCAMRGVEQTERNEAFLCFLRGDKHDIVLSNGSHAGHKNVGSAQRRRGTAILQHGSVCYDLPIGGAAHEPAASASTSTIADAISFGDLVEGVGRHSQMEQIVALTDGEWSDEELAAADQWAEEKYCRCDWPRALRRGPVDVPPALSLATP